MPPSDRRAISLKEYGKWTGELSPSELDALLLVAGTRLDVSPQLHGLIEIKATSHVGVICTDDLTVRVRPKVGLDNLFHLLGVDTALWKVGTGQADYGIDDEDVSSALVRLLCREVDRLTSRGLLHGYVEHHERLMSLRGRVDLNAVMRRPWEPMPVPCSFDEFVPDVFVNRALRRALQAARRLPLLSPAVRGELHLLLERFDGVSVRNVGADEIRAWRPSRSDRHYRSAMSLALVVLSHADLADRAGVNSAASFTIDMNKLFEEFVGRELRTRLAPQLDLEEQYSTALDVDATLSICPDFVVRRQRSDGQLLAVADTKYKLSGAAGEITDHYQLLAYSTVFGLNDGVLIYCDRDDGVVDEQLEQHVRSVEVINGGIRHHVYRLGLSGTRSDINSRLDELAQFLESIAISHERSALVAA